MLSPNAVFPRMFASEEANLILQDIFQTDAEGMNTVMGSLCEENSIAYDWDLNGSEINELLIDNEDLVAQMYEGYLSVNSAAFDIVEGAAIQEIMNYTV